MNTLVNLIKLQYNSLFALKKNLFIIVGLGIFFAAVQPTMIVFAGAMYLMIACYSVIFYEEKSKMNYLIYSLPIRINQYIFSKYIYGLLNTLIAILISTILNTIVKILGYNDFVNSMPIYAVPLITLAIGIFFTSVLMPATLLLGFEKGRFVLVFIAIAPVCFSAPLLEYLPNINLSLNTTTLSILGILISITLLLAYYFFTCNKFAKKEIS